MNITSLLVQRLLPEQGYYFQLIARIDPADPTVTSDLVKTYSDLKKDLF